MAAKKDQKLTVMVDEELKGRMERAAFEADVSGSDLARACMLAALPLFESTPSLVSIIPTLPVSVHREGAR